MYVEIARVVTTDHVGGKQQCEPLGTFITDVLPHIGEHLVVQDETFKVLDVTHHIHDLKCACGVGTISAQLLVE